MLDCITFSKVHLINWKLSVIFSLNRLTNELTNDFSSTCSLGIKNEMNKTYFTFQPVSKTQLSLQKLNFHSKTQLKTPPQELWFTPVTHTNIDLLAAFRSDNISQATGHVAVKAPIKSAWCCKSLVWFGACKPLESHWPARAKCAVRPWRGGRGYMVRLALYLMHHLPLRCWFNRQRSNNEDTFFDSHANWQTERELKMMASSLPRGTIKGNSC